MAKAWTLVLSDLYRYAGKTSLKALSTHYVRNRSFRYSFWLRLANSTNPVVSLGARVMHHRLTRKFGIQIQRRTKIGPGLYIAHHMCIVVHPKTVIGANCNLHQFTTIGSNHDTPAIIGDNVYIGPGCSIVENVSIGNGVTIGAGSVVTRDIPPNTTAAGVPARALSENAPGRFIRYPWPGAARPSSAFVVPTGTKHN